MGCSAKSNRGVSVGCTKTSQSNCCGQTRPYRGGKCGCNRCLIHVRDVDNHGLRCGIYTVVCNYVERVGIGAGCTAVGFKVQAGSGCCDNTGRRVDSKLGSICARQAVGNVAVGSSAVTVCGNSRSHNGCVFSNGERCCNCAKHWRNVVNVGHRDGDSPGCRSIDTVAGLDCDDIVVKSCTSASASFEVRRSLEGNCTRCRHVKLASVSTTQDVGGCAVGGSSVTIGRGDLVHRGSNSCVFSNGRCCAGTHHRCDVVHVNYVDGDGLYVRHQRLAVLGNQVQCVGLCCFEIKRRTCFGRDLTGEGVDIKQRSACATSDGPVVGLVTLLVGKRHNGVAVHGGGVFSHTEHLPCSDDRGVIHRVDHHGDGGGCGR